MENNNNANILYNIYKVRLNKYKIDLNHLVNVSLVENLCDCFLGNICSYIVLNPKSCKSCEILFCSDCINTWITKDSSCPNCKKIFIPEKLSRNLGEIFKQIPIYCPAECNTKLLVRDLENHLQLCQLTKLEAECLSCNSKINTSRNKKEILEHISNCPEVEIQCDKSPCTSKFKRKLEQEYIKNFCEYALFECQQCNLKLKRSDFKNHPQKECIIQINNKYTKIVEEKDKKLDLYQVEIEENNKKIKNLVNKIKILSKIIEKNNLLLPEMNWEVKKFNEHYMAVRCVLQLTQENDQTAIVTGGDDKDIIMWNVKQARK